MTDNWIEQQRRRWMRNDAHLWRRPDAPRFARPDAAREQQPIDPRWDPLGAAEQKYSASQPRVPAGSADGGQWTTVSSGGGISIAVPFQPGTDDGGTDEAGDAGGFDSSDLDWVQLAGDFPTGDSPPEIPEERPPKSADRTVILKDVARYIAATGETVVAVARMASWLMVYESKILTYNDPPRTLEELQSDLTPLVGYQIHHIVEQSSARDLGVPREMIDDPENLVRIPTMKHEEINGWYQKGNPNFGWQSPREYLSGRSWATRRAVGLEAMRRFGILKP